MKPQGQGSKFLYKMLINMVLVLTGTIFFISCENDIEKINAFGEEKNLPVRVGYDVETAYTDSGLLKGKLIAPELMVFQEKDDTYIEFPKGIKVIFYNESGEQTSVITSNYAINYPKKQLWIAKHNVVAKNEKEGKELYTEELYWDQKLGKIYSEVYSKIINPDGTFYGEKGFEADQDMSKWKLKQSKGEVNVKNEENN